MTAAASVRPFPGDGELAGSWGAGSADRGWARWTRLPTVALCSGGGARWWLPREEQPVSVPAQLRTMAQRADGSIGWRAGVPREGRAWIGEKVREAADLLGRLDVHDTAALAFGTQ